VARCLSAQTSNTLSAYKKDCVERGGGRGGVGWGWAVGRHRGPNDVSGGGENSRSQG